MINEDQPKLRSVSHSENCYTKMMWMDAIDEHSKKEIMRQIKLSHLIKSCLVVALLFLFGCMSPGYRVLDEIDPYTKVHMIKQSQNGGLALSYSTGYHFNLHYMPDSSRLMMELIYDASSWLFINEYTEAVIFLADGEKIALRTGKVYRDTYMSTEAMVKEWTYMEIDIETIKKLANAKSITCRIYGSKYYADATQLPKVQANWRAFIQEYLP